MGKDRFVHISAETEYLFTANAHNGFFMEEALVCALDEPTC